jgi:DNA-binding SARP family transcriptional activator
VVDDGSVPLVVPAKIRIPVHDTLPRARLEAQLAAAWRHRLTLVVAPAGSGKTTLLARFATNVGVPVGWYRAEAWDADEGSFVRHLEAALRSVLPCVPGGWATIEDAATALEQHPADAALLVIDDGHALDGTPAEASLGRLVDYAPPWLAIVVGSRVPPSINLPRLRVSGDLLELGQDDLRFRSWEVEELFRDVYHDPVPPADLAALARRMEGWAAGLQLFHLATRGRSAEERRRFLAAADARGRLLREYLAQNVLDDLPQELRGFLLDTCVLGRLTGPLCDRLRGTGGSEELLEQLARRSIFTVPAEDADDAYRYHEVLRSHLDRTLVAELGDLEAHQRYAQAAALLEASGALAEALVAWCRAEDWAAVARILDRGGERLASGVTSLLDALPPSLVRHDPWLALATARTARAEGRWNAALDWYARAEAGLGGTAASVACRRERAILAAWLDPGAILPAHWTGPLRAGLAREPLSAARDAAGLDDALQMFVRGLLLLVAGEVGQASRVLREVALGGLLEPSLGAAACLAAAVADLLRGDQGASEALAVAIESSERARVPWLTALGRSTAQLLGRQRALPTGGAADTADRPHETDADPWSAGLGALVAAWIAVITRSAGGGDFGPPIGRCPADLEGAATRFRRLGAGALEAWAKGLAALALTVAGSDGAREAAIAAESLGRVTGVAGVRLLAYRALEASDAERRSEYGILAASMEAETGLSIPAVTGWASDPEPFTAPIGTRSAPGLQVEVLGRFRMTVDGRSVDLDGVKPRARALLRLLALNAPAPVHREVLQEALWPDSDRATGMRSLQVAVSSLRSHLATVPNIDGGDLVDRRGDAYRLAAPDGCVDLRRFERAVAEARAAQRNGAEGQLARALRISLDLYHGDVLPEDGPAEWVVARREQVRLEALEAAVGLAELSLAAGDLSGAVHACRIGLGLDRYHDPLWRMLIVARDRAGDAGAASRDRRDYAAVLDTLGVVPSISVPSAT